MSGYRLPEAIKTLELALEKRDQEALTRHYYAIEAADTEFIQIEGQRYLNFSSNDYLGLARHPRVIKATQEALECYGVGSTASHAVCGNYDLHEALEQRLAAWVGHDQACLFSSGYQANLAVISTLLGHHDAIFSDKLNHACLNDGATLSRAAFHRFSHNNIDQLVALLERYPVSRQHMRMIAVDAVYSMDGDMAPLSALVHIAERHDAWLLIDDAHGLGVLGAGRGSLHHWNLMHHPRIIYMGTLGKALGTSGAFIAAHPMVIRTLMQRARPFIYTTALPPALAAGTLAALDIMEQEPERIQHLHALIQSFRRHLEQLQVSGLWSLAPSQTAIQPVILYTSERALNVQRSMREAGYWVPAIRPPTVPKHAARLRFTLSAAHRLDRLPALVHVLSNALIEHTHQAI